MEWNPVAANMFIAFNESVLGEIKSMEKSDQVYNVFTDTNNTSVSDETGYDFNHFHLLDTNLNMDFSLKKEKRHLIEMVLQL